MSDLVALLRKEVWITKGIAECEARDLMKEAADRIEALEAILIRCRGVLATCLSNPPSTLRKPEREAVIRRRIDEINQLPGSRRS